MVIALKIVNTAKNDPTSEIYPLATSPTLGYVFLLLVISMFSWCPYAYVWSFLFKSEIIGFVVLAIILGFAAFLDVIWTFLILLVLDGSTSPTGASRAIEVIRYIFALVFPNIAVKRGLYDLKIQNNSYCINNVNLYLAGSKDTEEFLINVHF